MGEIIDVGQAREVGERQLLLENGARRAADPAGKRPVDVQERSVRSN